MGSTSSGGSCVTYDHLIARHGDGIKSAQIPHRLRLDVYMCIICICVGHQDILAPFRMLDHSVGLDFFGVDVVQTKHPNIRGDSVESLDEADRRRRCAPCRELVRLSGGQPALGVVLDA